MLTGAGGALGRTVAEKANGYGAELILLDLQFDQDWVNGLGDAATAHIVNLMDAEAINSLIGEFSKIDGVINVAGGFDMGPTVHETSEELWSKMFDLNVKTLRNTVAAATPKLIASEGSIVNIGAVGAVQGLPNMGAYTASKSVVMRLTESMSEELKGQGVNVNAVLPSVIDTPANRDAMPDADFAQWVSPEQLAEVICFLSSESASGVHGALVPVRGLS